MIAGYIGLYGSYDEGDITNVAVAEAFRGNGIGTLLVKSMKEMAVRRGIRRIYLEVRDSNETARRVYEKAGFSVCGRRKKFYRQPEEDAVLMCLRLDGEILNGRKRNDAESGGENHAAREPVVLQLL